MTDRWPWKLKRTAGLPDHFVLVDALGEQRGSALVEGTSLEWGEVVAALRGPREYRNAQRVAVAWRPKHAALALYSPRNSTVDDLPWCVTGNVMAFELADSLEASLIDTLCPKCRERGNRVKVPITVRWEICARCRGELGAANTNPEGY